ncbi:MAG: hypothetical protein CMA64_00655 [Euryarchaeota archaeon]|nr:hypothetical protein [Euryarchaeota archaeon]
MATSTRQTNLFVSENWQKVYQTFKSADFQSYDFETLRTTMISYLRKQFPEDFNDFTESSEYIALIDLIAFFGQSLAYRQDLNARENFLETAQRRDSILRLANLLSYQPKRNTPASGLLKIVSVSTTEEVYDSNNNNLSERTIFWNDPVNSDYEEQYNTIINASLTSAQRVGKPALEKTIGSIKTQQYELNLIPGTQPYLPFNASVNSGEFTFELVNGTIAGQDYIYEKAPTPGSTYNLLYRTDGKGNASTNTGFFAYFKQGELGQSDFELTSGLPNLTFDLDFDNINNTDVWLYAINDDGSIGDEWTKVPSVSGSNVIYNSLSQSNRKLYSVESRVNDQIKLVFGDGVFADIPKGRFRCYYRQSAGSTYALKSNDIQDIQLSFNYVSRSNQQETMTLALSLQQGVNTASRNESLARIKQLAPQAYYTQNRMINGEDYNIYPLTRFTSIIKSKAVNRASSGISRFLDVKDNTGKFSSTNIFSDDGVFYKEYTNKKDTFSFTNDNEIINTIKTVLEPNIASKEMYHFYLDKFAPKVFTTTAKWVQVTATATTCTGYFIDENNEVLQISNTTNLNQYLSLNSMIKFLPTTGYHFMKNGSMMLGTDLNHLGASSDIWSSIKLIDNDGIGTKGAGYKSTGVGAVTLNEVVPTGATVEKAFPKWVSDLPVALETTIKNDIKEYKDFGLRYDYNTATWHIITSDNLAVDKEYNDSNTGSTTGAKLDASWMIQFTTNGETYTMRSRQLDYYFASREETRFYFDKSVKIYDSVTGSTIKDRCTVLKINNKPTSHSPLERDYPLDITDMVTEVDGYKDNTKVKVTFGDADNDSVTDNPEMFAKIVGTDDASGSAKDRKFVFFKRFLDYDNIERYQPIVDTTVNHEYKTLKEVSAVINLYNEGQVFYLVSENKFVELVRDNTNTLITTFPVSPGTEINAGNVLPAVKNAYKVFVGRNDLKFQYKHNAPNNRRIDPSPSNIIDMYILTQAYSDSYREWILDSTEKVIKPTLPTAESLRTSFSSIEDSKSISDTLIYHSAKFKPLFGSKADTSLQASFKVVKNTGSGISDSEVKSALIDAINSYFAIANWDFGDTFYFSELSAFLHNALATRINSVVIVPKSTSQVFGSLFQIRSNYDEILISGATVDDVEIIDSITASKIQAGGTISSLDTTVDTTSQAASSSSSTSGGSGY